MTNVALMEVRVARGLGGKGYLIDFPISVLFSYD